MWQQIVFAYAQHYCVNTDPYIIYSKIHDITTHVDELCLHVELTHIKPPALHPRTTPPTPSAYAHPIPLKTSPQTLSTPLEHHLLSHFPPHPQQCPHPPPQAP